MTDPLTALPMDTGLLSPTRVRAILSELGLTPSKTLGQNFLIDANILGIILDAAELYPEDSVLEVGPGLGVVTGCLLERVDRVLAIEKDHRLFDYLEARFRGNPRLTLLCRDALDAGLGELPESGVNKMVSNLPYSVASRVLVDIAGSEYGPERIVVTVQEEVARRLAATPRDPDYGLLSVRLQLRYRARVLKKVSPTCFWPPPRVGSMIVLLDRKPGRALSPETERTFELATKIAFEHRRKQMAGIFMRYWPAGPFSRTTAVCLLENVGIEPAMRPEAVDVDQWVRLAAELERATPDGNP